MKADFNVLVLAILFLDRYSGFHQSWAIHRSINKQMWKCIINLLWNHLAKIQYLKFFENQITSQGKIFAIDDSKICSFAMFVLYVRIIQQTVVIFLLFHAVWEVLNYNASIWSPFVMLTFVFLGRNSRARFISGTSASYLCDTLLKFSDALVYTEVTRLRSFSHHV